jgi:putative ABC transport system permease protein
MLKNYLKIAIRNLIKHKAFSLVNIAGFAIAWTCIIFISLFIKSELSYDGFHKNKDRIFRVNSIWSVDNKSHTQAVTQAPLAPAMKQDLPEVKLATRFLTWDVVIKHGDNSFSEKVLMADPVMFRMFSFQLLMNKWLQNFAYHIEMSWWMFALAGGLALAIALATVSWQAVRAATANPVEALRYE